MNRLFSKAALPTSLFMLILLTPAFIAPHIKVGIGSRDITPPLGTTSAGCFEREGRGMQGVHDPLLSKALIIDNGKKKIAFCSVDHLGFLRSMVQEILAKIHAIPDLEDCEVFIGSSHTHSGGGAYFDMPELGELLAGPYNAQTVQMYIDGATGAIVDAFNAMQPAKIGIGYGTVHGLTTYDGVWPTDINSPTDLTVIKVTKEDNSPLAVWFNYALYPDVLVFSDENHPVPGDKAKMVFSADVIGSARNHIESLIGGVSAVFFNGAIAEVLTSIQFSEDRFASCKTTSTSLAQVIFNLWNDIETHSDIDVDIYKCMYTFEPKPTPSGFVLPISPFETEIGLIIFNGVHAFTTIPAELHCSYDEVLKKQARQFGFERLTVLSMVNDNHGYIYPPQAWRLNPAEGEFSWGGEMYGQFIEDNVVELLKNGAPKKEVK